ncbi:hypothetical protein RRG08_021590 [Elysia crispata]|uniref:Uncharacterized protein n=1 Tax=Elysia crispata TaxID=231223 RepID=A0AAE0XDX9_9GAST|nr:hypothetical protein RRG08_021590 [Elysia crispata]
MLSRVEDNCCTGYSQQLGVRPSFVDRKLHQLFMFCWNSETKVSSVGTVWPGSGKGTVKNRVKVIATLTSSVQADCWVKSKTDDFGKALVKQVKEICPAVSPECLTTWPKSRVQPGPSVFQISGSLKRIVTVDKKTNFSNAVPDSPLTTSPKDSCYLPLLSYRAIAMCRLVAPRIT